MQIWRVLIYWAQILCIDITCALLLEELCTFSNDVRRFRNTWAVFPCPVFSKTVAICQRGTFILFLLIRKWPSPGEVTDKCQISITQDSGTDSSWKNSLGSQDSPQWINLRCEALSECDGPPPPTPSTPLENPGMANVIREHECDGGALGIKRQQASEISHAIQVTSRGRGRSFRTLIRQPGQEDPSPLEVNEMPLESGWVDPAHSFSPFWLWASEGPESLSSSDAVSCKQRPDSH